MRVKRGASKAVAEHRMTEALVAPPAGGGGGAVRALSNENSWSCLRAHCGETQVLRRFRKARRARLSRTSSCCCKATQAVRLWLAGQPACKSRVFVRAFRTKPQENSHRRAVQRRGRRCWWVTWEREIHIECLGGCRNARCISEKGRLAGLLVSRGRGQGCCWAKRKMRSSYGTRNDAPTAA